MGDIVFSGLLLSRDVRVAIAITMFIAGNPCSFRKGKHSLPFLLPIAQRLLPYYLNIPMDRVFESVFFSFPIEGVSDEAPFLGHALIVSFFGALAWRYAVVLRFLYRESGPQSFGQEFVAQKNGLMPGNVPAGI